MRWSGGNHKTARRDNVYRVDRELAQMKFFAGEALKKNTRTRFEHSHQVFIEGDVVKFQLYKTVIAERNLVTNQMKFRHGGWTTLETSKDIEPIFNKYFYPRLSMRRKDNDYVITRTATGEAIAIGAEGITLTPKGFGIWLIEDSHGEQWIWDLTVQQKAS